MNDPGPRGRLFRKYIVVFLLLVGGVLLVSSAIDLYFSYQETKAALVRIEREQAVAAAAAIERFVQDIERQVRWTTQAAFDDPEAAQEQREIDYLRLLRNVPAIAEISHLDAVRQRAASIVPPDPGRNRQRGGLLASAQVSRGQSREDILQPGVFPERVRAVHDRRGSRWRTRCRGHRRRGQPQGHLGRDLPDQDRQGGVRIRGRLARPLVAHPDISLVLQKRDLSALPQIRSARGPRSARGDEKRRHDCGRAPRWAVPHRARSDRDARVARVRRAAARRSLRAASSFHRPQHRALRACAHAVGAGKRAPGQANGRSDPGIAGRGGPDRRGRPGSPHPGPDRRRAADARRRVQPDGRATPRVVCEPRGEDRGTDARTEEGSRGGPRAERDQPSGQLDPGPADGAHDDRGPRGPAIRMPRWNRLRVRRNHADLPREGLLPDHAGAPGGGAGGPDPPGRGGDRSRRSDPRTRRGPRHRRRERSRRAFDTRTS